ncbi:MAG: hypothetical protein QMD22_00120 [archaeon]|nr:hypothetical protein [archaeon]
MVRTKRLHAVFDGKVLRPETAVDLEPNARYLVTIERKEERNEQSLWDVLSTLSGTVEGPEDWSEEHDHYVYGTPKRAKVRR